MAVTMMEVGSQYSKNVLRAGVVKTIVQNSSVLDRIKFKTIRGNAYTFRLEATIPAAQFRYVGGAYTRGSGSRLKVTETVCIMGNEVFIDNFEQKVAASEVDLKAQKFSEIARSIALGFDETFFEGDTNVNPERFNGLRLRITGNQLLSAGANGAALTIAMLDELWDTVITPNRAAYLNRTMRRKITTLARAQTGTVRVEYPKLDVYGKQVATWDDVPLLIVERNDDGSTILDYDETRGSSSVTASLYLVSFGDDKYVFGLLGAGGSLQVDDLGESENAPGHIGRIEFYPGIAIDHPRCAGRLRGITNA